jgi:hypothetical protein
MDYVKRHLKKIVRMFKCYYLVCKVKGLLLNNVMHFKNHVKIVHNIKLKDLKYIS